MRHQGYKKDLDPGKYARPVAAFIRFYAYLRRLFAEFRHDHCFVRASSLAYNTLLAMVPLLAFVFSLLASFADLSQIQEQLKVFLLELFLPTRQEEIIAYLDRFVANAGTLGTVGLLIFALTSILLLNTINENINAIWGSKSRRNFISKFTTYTSVIIFGSLLISTSFALTRSIRNIFNIGNPAAGFLMNLAIQVSPLILIFLTFLLIIVVVPAARINVASACLGAGIGSLLWNITKVLFVQGTNYVMRTSVMYGSLASIPIFLVWLYLTWLIILLSLEITFLHQYRGNPWTGRNLSSMEPMERLSLGLEVFFTVAEGFHTGARPPSVIELARSYSMTLEDARNLIDLFQEAGLVYPIRSKETRYTPSKPLESISLKEVILVLFGTPRLKASTASMDIVHGMFHQAVETVGSMTVRDALEKRIGK
ncbi:MAG: YihY family inner membrane protein [Spirochaetales bacterium]|nr:YihY family inner membrane protein [Spirochaetales bacterium]